MQDIFAWKLMGLSANSIAAKLNERGTLSPAEYKKAHGEKFKTSFQRNPEAKWTPKAVLRILSNEIYIGVLEQGKREKVSYKVKKTIEKPKSQWIRVENNHTPIITEADFKAVQELLKRDTRAKERMTEPKLYAGLLFCGDCGRGLVSRKVPYKDTVNEYYICSGYNRGKECTRHSIKVDVLNEIVLGEVRKYVKQLTDTLIISAPDENKEQEKFLGYKWSNRKGQEGIQIIKAGGCLYNSSDRSDNNSIAGLIRNAFSDEDEFDVEDLSDYYYRLRLQDMLDFSGTTFNKSIKTTPTRVLKDIPGLTNYRLADKNFFDLSIGNRVLSDEVVENGSIPIYSASY